MMTSTLYYDGHCPVCRREMALLEQARTAQLELRDIHTLQDTQGLPHRDQLLGELHYRTPKGVWLTGIDATVAAWSHTRFGFLWKVLHWPLIKPAAERVYRYWAKRRYARLYG